jgi:hypothetical protein
MQVDFCHRASRIDEHGAAAPLRLDMTSKFQDILETLAPILLKIVSDLHFVNCEIPSSFSSKSD